MRRSRRGPHPGRQRVRVAGEPSGGPLCWVEEREAPGSKDPAIWLEPHQPFWVRADRSGARTRIHAVRVRREQRAPVKLGSMSSPAQLLIYGFEPGAEFEGRMVGAIERIESGGTLRVLDVVFVMRDPETAELVAIEQHGRGQGSLVAPLLGFRLDQGEGGRQTEKAPRADANSGVRRPLGDSIEPGPSVSAGLVEQVWVRAL